MDFKITAKFLNVVTVFAAIKIRDFSRHTRVELIRDAAAYVGLTESALVKSITSRRDLSKRPSPEIRLALFNARRCYHAQFGR